MAIIISSRPAPPPPSNVTALQFITALTIPPLLYFPDSSSFLSGIENTGYITEAEAEAWVSRIALPSIALAAINALPQEQQFSARLAILGMSTVELNSPLLAVALNLLNVTPEQRVALRDSLFRFAATLFSDS